jgi:hypothetical protein
VPFVARVLPESDLRAGIGHRLEPYGGSGRPCVRRNVSWSQ